MKIERKDVEKIIDILRKEPKLRHNLTRLLLDEILFSELKDEFIKEIGTKVIEALRILSNQ